MIWFLLLLLLSPSQSDNYSNKQIPSTYLRPKPKARAGGADDEAAAVYSFTFTSAMKIGTNRDKYTLTIGVLMEDIWITEPDCEKCKLVSQSYNKSAPSSTDLNIRSKYSNDILDLDIAGNLFEDELIIENDYILRGNISVATRFVDVRNLAIDGILGLGKDEKSIVYKMFYEGLIDKPIYSVSYLSSPYLIFGTPNFLSLSLVVQSQQDLSIASTLQVTSFSFGNFTNNDPCDLEINSLTSYLLGPFDVLEAVFKVLVNEGCHYEEELLMCECEDVEYPEFIFTIQNQEIALASSEYLITLGDNCFVALKSGKAWILGEPFLKAYFTEYNLETKKIRISKVSALEDDLLSPFETTEGWTVMISLAIASVAIYIFAFFIYVKYEDYKKQQFIDIQLLNSTKKKPRIL
ncbi:hypothetical protein SteCoe_32529 [Stentor coeruleus]|uniref:Peptidase A1 domain-containing protein n=1 Tax=Stentor coeruleus TaxID=5963 RepID=A0A1R2AYU1_9CILI|nr:hypothetical protein SteCoe_32529 [Stentor coeruleus]